MTTVKFLIFDLISGKPKEIPTYFVYFLNKLPEVEILSAPSEEFYILLCPMQNFHWYGNTAIFDTDSPLSTKRILSDLKNKKCGLLFVVDTESFGILPIKGLKNSPDVLSLVNKTAEFLNIDRDIITYSDTNYVLPKVLARKGVTSIWYNPYEIVIKPENTINIVKDISNKIHRSKKFLYLGGKPREFRLRFLYSLLKIPNFEKDSLITTGSGKFIEQSTKQVIYVPGRVLDYTDILNKNYGLLEKEAMTLNINFYTSTYLNIIPMSQFYMNHSIIEINEKMFKPIAIMQPFIVLGQPKLLQSLHELGYKTFNQWINEDYDLILDDEERLVFLVKEIERLNLLTHSEWTTMLMEMLPVLQHNADLHRSKYESLHNEKLVLEKIRNKYNI